jgi:hypothetical protein
VEQRLSKPCAAHHALLAARSPFTHFHIICNLLYCGHLGILQYIVWATGSVVMKLSFHCALRYHLRMLVKIGEMWSNLWKMKCRVQVWSVTRHDSDIIWKLHDALVQTSICEPSPSRSIQSDQFHLARYLKAKVSPNHSKYSNDFQKKNYRNITFY